MTGKGGVGKTVVSAALGLVSARQGKRTLVCEVAQQERLSGLFGLEGLGHEERELSPGLFGMSIDPEQAKEQWLRYQLKSGALAGVLGQSRIFQLLTAAAPGLTELVTVGKIWELAQLERKEAGAPVYDLVIVDSPATGHSVAMLRAPRTFGDIAKVGPIHRQAGIIDGFLRNRRSTGVLAVALPEEMPVNETLDLSGRLRDDMGMAIDAVVVNAVYPERFSAEEARAMASVDGRVSPAARTALRAALSEHHRARAQRSQLRRLRRGLDGVKSSTLPYLFEPQIGAEQVERLSRELERAL